VHLEPGFMRLFDKQPPVGFAGIKEKFPIAAFAASLACFYSFRSAHRIHLSSAMSLVCSGSPGCGQAVVKQPAIPLYVERAPTDFTDG
jgi:hypothetical protein